MQSVHHPLMTLPFFSVGPNNRVSYITDHMEVHCGAYACTFAFVCILNNNIQIDIIEFKYKLALTNQI